MRVLSEFIEKCHKTAVEKGFYEETQRSEMPDDEGQLVYLAWHLNDLNREIQRQRKKKEIWPTSFHENWFPYVSHPDDFDGYRRAQGMDTRRIHIYRQMLHLVGEVGEFIHDWLMHKDSPVDYDEFADIFIVWADIAGFLDTKKVMEAIEKKMKKNETREIGYGRAEDLGFVDLTTVPGVVEELTGHAPTFDELAKTWAEMPYTNDEVTIEMEDKKVCTCGDPNCTCNEEEELKESHKEPEEPQEKMLKKIFGNSYRQSLQGGVTEPLDKSNNGMEELSK